MMPAGRVAAKLHAELHAGMMRPGMRRGAGRDAADGVAAGAECRDDADGFTPKGGSRCRDVAAGPACRTCGGRRAATGAADRYDAAGARGGRGSDRLGERNCVDSAFRSFPFRQANRFRMLSIRKHGEGPHRVVRAFIEGPHRMTHAFARGSPCVATGASPRGARTRPKGVFLSFPMPGGAAYGARDAAALHLVQYG